MRTGTETAQVGQVLDGQADAPSVVAGHRRDAVAVHPPVDQHDLGAAARLVFQQPLVADCGGGDEPVDLSRLVERLLSAHVDVFAEKRLTLKGHIAPDITVLATEEMVERAIRLGERSGTRRAVVALDAVTGVVGPTATIAPTLDAFHESFTVEEQ